MKNTVIRYLDNSSFLIETSSKILIFDYFNDDSSYGTRELDQGVITDKFLQTHKEIYVFASHSHYDHYNPLIFRWREVNPKIRYILSSDIEVEDKAVEYKSIYEGDSFNIGDIEVKALGSTDLGVSFLIKTDNLNIFHAGDLNWWHWYDESDEYNLNMEKDFKAQIDKLKGQHIDIAFFPVDGRLKEYYYLGGEYFIQELKPKLFIPMHFSNSYEIIQVFKEKLKNSETEIVVINRRGQQIC